MSKNTELTEPDAPESPNAFLIMTKLEAVGTMKPADLFKSESKTLELAVDQISEYCLAFKPDMTVKKDREAVRSLAATIARTKTFIDDSGKELLEEAKALTDRVNGQRRWAREKLDELKDTVRKPLTEFEEAEKRLAERKVQVMEQIAGLSDGIDTLSSGNIEERISTLTTIFIGDLEELPDIADKAKMKIVTARARLEKALPLALAREAAELKAEQDRIAAEAEARRIHEEQIAKDAADKAKADAEEKAAADAKKAKEDADAAAAKAKADSDAAIAKAEADAAKAKRDAEFAVEAEKARARAERQAEEEAEQKRAADMAHRSRILHEAADDIYTVIKSNPDGDALANAIAAGKIRHVSIQF